MPRCRQACWGEPLTATPAPHCLHSHAGLWPRRGSCAPRGVTHAHLERRLAQVVLHPDLQLHLGALLLRHRPRHHQLNRLLKHRVAAVAEGHLRGAGRGRPQWTKRGPRNGRGAEGGAGEGWGKQGTRASQLAERMQRARLARGGDLGQALPCHAPLTWSTRQQTRPRACGAARQCTGEVRREAVPSCTGPAACARPVIAAAHPAGHASAPAGCRHLSGTSHVAGEAL